LVLPLWSAAHFFATAQTFDRCRFILRTHVLVCYWFRPAFYRFSRLYGLLGRRFAFLYLFGLHGNTSTHLPRAELDAAPYTGHLLSS
jgi:hypothetical protein